LLKDIISDVDMVCLMSVNPGFGGQKFIEHTYRRVKELKALIIETGSTAKIEIDGGVSMQNAKQLLECGADILVAGNFVFSSKNPTETINKLKNIV
jgi:ribulose-phosphate 3-epimerase